MNKQIVLYCIVLILTSCKSKNKNVIGDTPLEYYIIMDGLQVMTISNDSMRFAQILSTTSDYFGADASARFHTKQDSLKILEMTKSGPQIEIYTEERDKKIEKTILQFDSSKNKLSVLLEDTLFDNLKAAKKYKPDLQTKFLFDYYTKAYLSKFIDKPKIYNCDSVTIYRFIEKFNNLVISNKEKIKNTRDGGFLYFLLMGELLNKTFIAMDLNPFIATRSDSLDAIMDMIPKIE